MRPFGVSQLIAYSVTELVLDIIAARVPCPSVECTQEFILRFFKIEQLNKVSTLEVVQLVRDSVHTICDVCVSKLDV